MRGLKLLACAVSVAASWPVVVAADGGSDWAELDTKDRIVVVLMYDQGRQDGCLVGVRTAADALFPDADTRMNHFARLVDKCPERIAWTDKALPSIVRAIDAAYSVNGAARLPLTVLLKLAVDAHLAGKTTIPRGELQEWIKAVR